MTMASGHGRAVRHLTPDAKAVLVNSPNNPTGWVMEKPINYSFFHCRKHGIWIISDDVYSRYINLPIPPNMMSCGHQKTELFR